MKKCFIPLIMILSASTSFAGYTVKIPLEVANGGSLANGSILIGSNNSQNEESGNGTPPTDTQEPVTPEEPKPEEKPEEPKERSVVFSGNFNTFSNETNLWTDGKKDAFSTSYYDIIIKGALKQGSIYYVTNNDKECEYIADVCETISGQNRCGPYTSANLSGTNTILSMLGSQDKSCVTVNSIWGQKVVSNLKVYDGPKPE